MKRTPTARVALVLVLCLTALPLIVANSAGGSSAQTLPTPTPTATPICPPGEEWTPWGGCHLIVVPCPGGTIDINGNGNNDGGGDCQPLDVLPKPMNCAIWPGGPYLPPEGYATCALPLFLNGQPLTLMGAAGCVDVTRKPYPRAMVNTATLFTINGIFPGVRNLRVDQPGGYRLRPDLDPWTTEGLFIHERYGNLTIDSTGRPAFNTQALLSGDSHPYPSLNNLRANLIFFVPGLNGTFQWTVKGQSGATLLSRTSGPIDKVFAFASYPTARSAFIEESGPDLNGHNTLPAFQVALRSTWDVWLMVEWDNYSVNGNNAYVRSNHEGYGIRLGAYYSYRVWDEQQSLTGVQSIYCNASATGGYIPVPVLEAQAILK